MPSYPCPCCGHLTFDAPPGSFDICPVCFWEDDLVQLRFPMRGGGANKPSLVEAQANFRAVGACEVSMREHCRAPKADEPVEEGWRPLDPATDHPEVQTPGVSYGGTHPADATTLYWWRPTWWRRLG